MGTKETKAQQTPSIEDLLEEGNQLFQRKVELDTAYSKYQQHLTEYRERIGQYAGPLFSLLDKLGVKQQDSAPQISTVFDEKIKKDLQEMPDISMAKKVKYAIYANHLYTSSDDVSTVYLRQLLGINSNAVVSTVMNMRSAGLVETVKRGRHKLTKKGVEELAKLFGPKQE